MSAPLLIESFSSLSNLARDCIPIDQTAESLPLNLIFKQIKMDKLKDYLRQSDFEEYFRRSKPYEEFIRENLIASDFRRTGVHYIDYFWRIFMDILLVKSLLLLGLGNLERERESFVPRKTDHLFFFFCQNFFILGKEQTKQENLQKLKK